MSYKASSIICQYLDYTCRKHDIEMHSVQSPRAPPAAHEASAPHFFAAHAPLLHLLLTRRLPDSFAHVFGTFVAVVGKVYVVNGIKYDQTGAMVTGMC